MSDTLRAFSYGGGVQSTAALVLAARGEITYPLFLFANTGDDSEHPHTLRYVREVALPYAAEHGIELLEIQKRRRNGTPDTLIQRINRGKSSVPIPARMERSGAPGNRSCTDEFKIRVVSKEVKRRGATKERPALVGLGISLDEYRRIRAASDPRSPLIYRVYPLIDLEMTRQDCLNVIAKEGLPIPPRSACWFCPFHSLEEWRRLQRETPDLFEKSCQLEEAMQARRIALGKDAVYFTDAGARERLPLQRIVGPDVQLTMEEESCEGGFCMT